MKAEILKQLYAQLSRWAFPLAVIAIILFMRDCSGKGDEITRLELNLDSLAKQVVQVQNERGQLVAEAEQQEIQTAAQLKELTDTIFQLKKRDANRVKTVQQYARIIQEFKAKEKFAPFVPEEDSTPAAAQVPVLPVDSNLIRVPRPFLYADSTVSFAGTVTRAGVRLDSIEVLNTLHYRTLVKKTGFLRWGRTSTVQVLNSNPAITTTGLTTVTVPHRPGWWHRWGKPLTAALIAGGGVYYLTK